MDFTQDINEYIKQEIAILEGLDVESVNKALNLLEDTRHKSSRVYVFGNGGSSSTASHFQNDFNKGVSERLEKKYHLECLNDNVATLMAIANDNGFDKVFVQQLENKLEPDDVIIAISGSGNSKNVINAVEYAKKNGNKVIGLTGYGGGRVKELADICLHVPIDNMQITEDVHIVFNHLMMFVLYKNLVGPSNE